MHEISRHAMLHRKKAKFWIEKNVVTQQEKCDTKKIWNGMAQVFSSWMLAFTYQCDHKRMAPIFFHLLAPEIAF